MDFTERSEHNLEIIPPFSIIQCRRADIKDGVEAQNASLDARLSALESA